MFASCPCSTSEQETQGHFSELEAESDESARQVDSDETAKQLRFLPTSAQFAERYPGLFVAQEETAEGVKSPRNLPRGYTELDMRLITLEQQFSKFEQRLSNAEELSLQRPQFTQYSTQKKDLTTTIGNSQSARHGFADESVPYPEGSLTEQLTQMSKKIHLLEQRVNDSQGGEPASDQRESLVRGPPKKASTSSESAIQHMEYTWNSSVWDVAVFSFSDQLNFGESVVVIACLVFTLALLSAFTYEVQMLISDKFARFDAASQQDYYLWRSTVAHDLNYRSKFNDASLASSICNGRLYAPMSSLQLQTALDLDEYLDKNTFVSLPRGQYIGFLCLCLWYLTLVEEFRIIFSLLGASSALKIGPRTTFEPDMDSDGSFHIVKVTYLRRFSLGFLLFLRTVLVCILGWQGTLFLLSEVVLENILLNSAALQMLLSFDELLFQTVPIVPQSAVERMKPLKIPSRCPKCWHKWGLFVFFVSSAAIAFIFTHAFIIVPFVEDLNDSWEALCGGITGSYDFVVAVDAIGIPWAAATTPISDNVQEAYVERAMAAARTFSFQSRPLQSSQRKNLGLFMQVASSLELEHAVSNLPEFKDPTEWSMINREEGADVVGWTNEFEVLGQRDFADEPDTVYNHYLQHLLKQTGDVGCAQVPVSSCTKPGRNAEHVVMRKLCPTRCGCASPTEGTVANTYGSSSRSIFTGCAVWNTRKKTFVDRLQDLPCADTGNRDDFVSWSRGVGDAVHNSGEMLIDHLVSTFDSGKCPDVVKINVNGWRICQETSLPSICPESCGCKTDGQEWTTSHTSRFDFCPYSCYSSHPPCMTVTVAHEATTTRGPHAGFACIFPFKFQGVTYHSCTSKSWIGPWCAVTLLDGVSHFWGACPNTSACVNRST